MLYKVDKPAFLLESYATDHFKDSRIDNNVHLYSDLYPHVNAGHVIPERDFKYEIIPGIEDHGPQPILMWKGYRARPRAEMIIFNNRLQILVRINNEYKNAGVTTEFPGGAVDRGESFLQAAIRECKEELHLEVKEALDTKVFFVNQIPPQSTEQFTNVLDYTQICCALYGGKYTENDIDEVDEDPKMLKESKWMNINEVNLTPAHEEAIRIYKAHLFSRGLTGREVVNESKRKIDSITWDEGYKSMIESGIISPRLFTVKTKSGEAKVSNFNNFIVRCTTPEYALDSFKANSVSFVNYSNLPPGLKTVIWPDHLMTVRIGNCVDFTIFMHLYLKYRRIEHEMVSMIWCDIRGKLLGGHYFPIYKDKNKWVLWNYLGDSLNEIVPLESNAKSSSELAARKLVDKYFAKGQKYIFVLSEILPPNDLAIIESYYNREIDKKELTHNVLSVAKVLEDNYNFMFKRFRKEDRMSIAWLNWDEGQIAARKLYLGE